MKIAKTILLTTRIDLSGKVSVLRLDNEDSYQGPLPANLVAVGL